MNFKQLFSSIVIAGTILNASQALAQLKVGSNPATINTNTSLEAESTDGTRLRVNADNGNVGVGTTAAPTNKLHVGGTDPLRLEGLQPSAVNSSNFLVVDANGVVKTQPQALTSGATLVLARMSAATLASTTAYGGGGIFAVPYDQPEINVGGAWDASNYEFTAPANGFYEFSASAMQYNGSSTDILTRLGISKPNAIKPGSNADVAIFIHTKLPNLYNGLAFPTAMHIIGTLQLTAGQKIFIQGRFFYSSFGAATGLGYDPVFNNKLVIKYLGQ